ncbi:MAG: hypothetical protein INF79_10720 [Roseomonas sp.]|nr:hypothetical protein [Roseomonas sp.]MCA3327149.1 hypothetical protein [Roseomonas sp.]MCA3332001.1 hypothetical protein [Roseomonas sp.]MCA3334649.1 hypothetical protein [Roseomonas sp.]MCA3345423.1 hypothetical protein [Roseomonas sp.]
METDKIESLYAVPMSPMLELAVLSFWATAIQIERSFGRREIEAIPELSRAIQAAHSLPLAIGWGDVYPLCSGKPSNKSADN